MGDSLLTASGWVYAKFDAILAGQASLKQQLDKVQADLNQILAYLNPPPAGPPVEAVMNITIGDDVKTTKAISRATADLQIADSGQTGTITITLVDGAGEPANMSPTATVAVAYTVNDPTNPSAPEIAVTPVAASTPNSNVQTATFAPSLPSPPPATLSTGVVVSAVVTVSDTNPANPTLTFSTSGQPIDLTAGGPAGATMAESA